MVDFYSTATGNRTVQNYSIRLPINPRAAPAATGDQTEDTEGDSTLAAIQKKVNREVFRVGCSVR